MNAPTTVVCSAFSTVRTEIVKVKGARRTPFEFRYNGVTYARFDSEDKARLYQDAFQEGATIGAYLTSSHGTPA